MTAEEIGRYRRWPIARDLSIGGGGGLAAAVFGSLPNLATWVAVIFWVLAAIFAGFAAITLVRAFSRVSVEAEGLRMRGPLPRLVRWDAIKSLELKYYSTNREGKYGWFQLILADTEQTIKVTSDLNGFEAIVVRAVQAARRRGAALSPTTLANLADMNVADAAMADANDGDDRGDGKA
jgi:hypothetical protein